MQHKAFQPVKVGRIEWMLIRLFFAVAVVFSMWAPLPFTTMASPKGLAYLVNVTVFGGDAYLWLRPLIVLGGLLYVFNVLNPFGVLILTVTHLGYNTLHNSQGFTYHGNNMIGLILLAQCGSVLFWLIWKWIKGTEFQFATGLNQASYLLYFSQCSIAAVYVTSAITKVSKTGGMWLFESHYLAKSIVKTHRQTYYDNPSISVYEPVIGIAQWLAEHPWLTRIIMGSGFFLELFAFAALWNRTWAAFIGISMILFHFGVEWIMKLDFRVNQMMCLIFLVNLPFWFRWVATRRGQSL